MEYFIGKVVCGEQLPKPGMSDKGEIVDPFVRLQVLGIPQDEYDEKSESVTDNGFNPVFNKRFAFSITCPELAVIRISVYDKNKTANEFLCENYLPVRQLKKGCRSIPMLNQYAKAIDGCVLFGEIRMRELRRTMSVGSDKANTPTTDLLSTAQTLAGSIGSGGSLISPSPLGTSLNNTSLELGGSNTPLSPSADRRASTNSYNQEISFFDVLNDV